MFFAKTNVPEIRYALIQKLLRDMPWLWAIRRTWTDDSKAIVLTARYEDGFVNDDQRGHWTCYMHVVRPLSEEVLRIDFTDSMRSMLTVFQFLRDGLRISPEFVKHVVFEPLPGQKKTLLIYRSKNFKNVFEQHVCAHWKYDPMNGS